MAIAPTMMETIMRMVLFFVESMLTVDATSESLRFCWQEAMQLRLVCCEEMALQRAMLDEEVEEDKRVKLVPHLHFVL